MALLGICLGAFGCGDSTGLSQPDAPLIQTDAPEYFLQSDWIGWSADIPYIFTNRTGATVQLPNCNGGFSLHLERKDRGVWRTAWSPVLLMCASPAIVINRGSRFADTLHVWGAPPSASAYPQFDTEHPSGTYRIVWDAVSSSLQGIPLTMRVSNEFLLKE
jgi:hypothetical protein